MSDAGAAQFRFVDTVLTVQVDDQDDPNGHGDQAILFTDAGTMVSFSIENTGTAEGTVDVNVSVDGNQVQTWTSDTIAPGGQGGPFFVHGCGRLTEGDHAFSAALPDGTHVDNNANVQAPAGQGTPTPAPGGGGGTPTPTPSP